MNIIRNILVIIIAVSVVLDATGQSKDKLIRKGNRSYEDGNYKKAEIDYLKAIQSENPTHKGLFNLGNAKYKQKIYTEATAAFDSVLTMNLDKETKSKAFYNLGNSLLKLARDSAQIGQQVLPASIESFKNSLRLNPDDYEAKYNLAYAQSLLKEQQQQQNQQQQNQQQNQDQEQQQDQQQQQNQQDQQEQDKQEQNQQQQQEQKEQKKQRQNQPREISKEDAERMLQALKNDEKKTMEKMQKAKVKEIRSVKSEKDW